MFFPIEVACFQLTSKSNSIMFMPCMYGKNHRTTFCARFSWSKELVGKLYLTCFQWYMFSFFSISMWPVWSTLHANQFCMLCNDNTRPTRCLTLGELFTGMFYLLWHVYQQNCRDIPGFIRCIIPNDAYILVIWGVSNLIMVILRIWDTLIFVDNPHMYKVADLSPIHFRKHPPQMVKGGSI